MRASTVVLPTDSHSTGHAVQRTEVVPPSRTTSNIGLLIAHDQAAHYSDADDGTCNRAEEERSHYSITPSSCMR